MRYHLIALRIAIMKKIGDNKCWQGRTLLVEMKWVQPLCKTVQKHLKK